MQNVPVDKFSKYDIYFDFFVYFSFTRFGWFSKSVTNPNDQFHSFFSSTYEVSNYLGLVEFVIMSANDDTSPIMKGTEADKAAGLFNFTVSWL